MTVLRKYAKPKKEYTTEKRTLSVRIPADLYDRWQAACEDNGFSMSEGIRLLLELDLKANEETAATYDTRLPGGNLLLTDSSDGSEGYESKRTSPNNNGRAGSVKPYMVNNQLPCPVCGTWSSKVNFARDHTKKHGFKNAYEFIQANKEKVREMIKEREEDPPL